MSRSPSTRTAGRSAADGRPLAAPPPLTTPPPLAAPAAALTRRRLLACAGALTLAPLAVALSACASPVERAREAQALDRARELMERHWLDKYGERVSLEPRRVYWPSQLPIPGRRANDVQAQAGGATVWLEHATGRVYDNRQAREVTEALDTWVQSRLTAFVANEEAGHAGVAWAQFSSQLDRAPSTIGPLTDEEWQLVQEGVWPYDAYAGMSRDAADSAHEQKLREYDERVRAAVEPLAFGTLAFLPTPLAGDDPYSNVGFTARFDGDAEAFLAAERAAGGVAPPPYDPLYVAVAGAPPFPAAGEARPWRDAMDRLLEHLARTLGNAPETYVACADDARRGWVGGGSRLAYYPSFDEEDLGSGYEEGPGGESAGIDPVFDAWLDMLGDGSLLLDSNVGGLILDSRDVWLEETTVTTASLGDATEGRGRGRLAPTGPVWALRLSEAVRDRLAGEGTVPGEGTLRASLHRPDLVVPGDSEEASYLKELTRTPMLYAFEVAGVGADGRIEPVAAGPDGYDYACEPRELAGPSGGVGDFSLRDAGHTLLLFVATLEKSQGDTT